MEIVIREPEEVQGVQTAGLASGYHRTNITTTGVSAVAETGGYLLVGLSSFPIYVPLPLAQPSLQMHLGVVQVEDELVEGYETMAAENSQLAEEFLPAALEEWPMWEA